MMIHSALQPDETDPVVDAAYIELAEMILDGQPFDSDAGEAILIAAGKTTDDLAADIAKLRSIRANADHARRNFEREVERIREQRNARQYVHEFICSDE